MNEFAVIYVRLSNFTSFIYNVGCVFTGYMFVCAYECFMRVFTYVCMCNRIIQWLKVGNHREQPLP